MRTTLAIASIFAASLLGCATTQPGDSDPTDSTDQWSAAVRACHLEHDPSINRDVDMHACASDNTKKTTICHIPPGNPSNAHTICVGNAAVPAHVTNHGDSIGACVNEPPCQPPTGNGGTGGSGGQGGSGGDTGGTGGGTGGTGGDTGGTGGGTGGTGGGTGGTGGGTGGTGGVTG